MFHQNIPPSQGGCSQTLGSERAVWTGPCTTTGITGHWPLSMLGGGGQCCCEATASAALLSGILWWHPAGRVWPAWLQASGHGWRQSHLNLSPCHRGHRPVPIPWAPGGPRCALHLNSQYPHGGQQPVPTA
uniref:Uncharacterized protein n=1 Tax=Myotis myotis TaxID=51298 RepID=A0A7J7WW38_MYOMY|nr:hypothetical protein mMyoMyo1_011877 [Myotis myotis]